MSTTYCEKLWTSDRLEAQSKVSVWSSCAWAARRVNGRSSVQGKPCNNPPVAVCGFARKRLGQVTFLEASFARRVCPWLVSRKAEMGPGRRKNCSTSTPARKAAPSNIRSTPRLAEMACRIEGCNSACPRAVSPGCKRLLTTSWLKLWLPPWRIESGDAPTRSLMHLI